MNKIWAKSVPELNRKLLLASAVLVFTVNLGIAAAFPKYFVLWYMMLGVLAAFSIFFFFENFFLSPRLKHKDETRLDSWISAVIAGRNFIFLLNFIPVAQVIGIYVLWEGAWQVFIKRSIESNGEFGMLGAIAIIMPALLTVYVVLVSVRLYQVSHYHR